MKEVGGNGTLAKKYGYVYDVVISLSHVEKVASNRGVQSICRDNLYYPLCNTEWLEDYFKGMREKISKKLVIEWDKKRANESYDKDMEYSVVQSMMQEYFAQLKLVIIKDDGYKGHFYYDPKGVFYFDLRSVTTSANIMENRKQWHIIKLQGNDDEVVIDLNDVCPGFWCGRWTLIEKAL